VKALVVARLVWLEILRRKDLYVLGLALAAALAALLATDAFGAEGAARYVLDSGVTLAWAVSLVLAVTAAGRQLPADEARGTVYALLSTPLSRTSALLGKWLGAWTAASAATALCYAAALGAAALRGGAADARTLVQALALHAAAIAVVCAMAIAVSTRLSHGATLVISGIAVWACGFLAAEIPALAVGAGPVRQTALLALYYAVPHLSLFDLRLRLAHAWGPAPAGAVAAALASGAGWTALLLTLAAVSYRRRYFRRDAA